LSHNMFNWETNIILNNSAKSTVIEY